MRSIERCAYERLRRIFESDAASKQPVISNSFCGSISSKTIPWMAFWQVPARAALCRKESSDFVIMARALKGAGRKHEARGKFSWMPFWRWRSKGASD